MTSSDWLNVDAVRGPSNPARATNSTIGPNLLQKILHDYLHRPIDRPTFPSFLMVVNLNMASSDSYASPSIEHAQKIADLSQPFLSSSPSHTLGCSDIMASGPEKSPTTSTIYLSFAAPPLPPALSDCSLLKRQSRSEYKAENPKAFGSSERRGCAQKEERTQTRETLSSRFNSRNTATYRKMNTPLI